MTRDLSYHRCDPWREFEGAIFNEKATHSTKIDRPEEIFKVCIEDKPTAAVNLCIGDYCSSFVEAVRGHP